MIQGRLRRPDRNQLQVTTYVRPLLLILAINNQFGVFELLWVATSHAPSRYIQLLRDVVWDTSLRLLLKEMNCFEGALEMYCQLCMEEMKPINNSVRE